MTPSRPLPDVLSFRWLACLLAFMFLLVSPARADTLPAGVSQGPSIEGITEYRLENGLKVLLAPDDSRANTTVNMTYLVGSRHENYGQTGMAHLLEHMLFRGTPTLRNALGEFSRRGLSANGTTSADRTNYYASFTANPELLDWYLNWQADVMVNALILREDLDAEMTVVRNEMERGENSPFQMLMQRMNGVAYEWHNYGKSVIGARSDVENVDIDQLRAFYRMYYQPDNAVLIVSGKFNPDATLDTIVKAFGPIPRPERTLPPEYTEEPVQDGARQVILRRQGGSPMVASMYHAPAAATPEFTALDVAVAILADTPSGPLYTALVESGEAAQVFGFSAERRQPGYALFGAQLSDAADPQKALDTLNATVQSPPEGTFTDDALSRIRSRWLTGWENVYADPSSLASALSESVAAGDWRLFFLQRDWLESLSLDAVRQAASDYLVDANRSSGMYLPTEKPVRAPAPAQPDLADLVKDYAGREVDTQATAFDASPANIDAATQRSPLELASGPVQLALLPKATRGDRVEAALLIQFGDAESLKGKREVASAAASLLAHGTSTLSRQEIEDRFTALETQVDFSGGGGVLTVSLSSRRDRLPDALALALQVVKDASFPERELAEYQRQVKTAIDNAMSDPGSLASRALARHDNPWPADDVRYTPTFEEEAARIAALTREQLQDFHAGFYGAGTIRLAAVGEFDPEAIRQVLSSGLSGWRKAPAYERLADPFRKVEPEVFMINTPDKANAMYLAAGNVAIQDTDPDYAALTVANYLLGGSQTSRLWDRIRVQEGLSYSVGSSFDASSWEPSGSWSLYAIHAPENTERLRNAMQDELASTLKNGFSEEEVREAANAILNFRKLARSRDGALVSAWLNYLQLGRSFEWSATIDKALEGLTAEQVNAAFRRHFQPETFSTAIAGDQSKQ